MTYFVYLAHALNCNTKTKGTKMKTNGTKIGLLLKTVDTGYAAHICFICTGLRIRDRGNATLHVFNICTWPRLHYASLL